MINDKRIEQEIIKMVFQSLMCFPLRECIKLNIPRLMDEGHHTVENLAMMTGAKKENLYRILRALSVIGFFKETSKGEFKSTELSQGLLNERVESLIMMFLSRWHVLSWLEIGQSLDNDDIPFERTHGMEIFDFLKQNKEAALFFHQANENKALELSKRLLLNYSFREYEKIVDIGGGTGGVLFPVIKENKGLKGVIAEREELLPVVKDKVKKEDLEDVIEVIRMDFFSPFHIDGDCFLLVNILHDWNDEKCSVILKNIRKTMRKADRMLIVEMLVPNDGRPSPATIMDLEVWLMGNGKERTEEEFKSLLEKNDLKINKTIVLGNEYSLLECELKK